MKNALIIGATGQDGAYLSKLLLSKNYRIFGITRNIITAELKNLQYLQIDKDVQLIEFSQLDQKKGEKILIEFQSEFTILDT